MVECDQAKLSGKILLPVALEKLVFWPKEEARGQVKLPSGTTAAVVCPVLNAKQKSYEYKFT